MLSSLIGPRRLRPRGFTLVEVLTVIAIISFLVAFLTVVMVNMRAGARVQGARALVGKVGIALDLYNGDHRTLPPDSGFGWSQTGGLFGTNRLYDAGSLWRYLGNRIQKTKDYSGNPIVPPKFYGPYTEFKEKEISTKSYTDPDPANGQSFWIVDPFFKPLGYIGDPARLLHNRDGFDLFSCGPDGKTAWDSDISPTGCSNGLNYGTTPSTNMVYQTEGDNDGDGVPNNATELGPAAFNGTLTKTKRTVLPGEILDDINNWE